MGDRELMQSIKTKWGALIVDISHSTSIPEAFLAALIGNETGGDQNAKRFEPAVLIHLWEVLLGRKPNFGSIGRDEVLQFVAGAQLPIYTVPANLPSDTYQRMDSLATSWGLTQIMGYQVLGNNLTMNDLRQPETHLRFALSLLAKFANRFQLDVTKDFPPLFCCWNTGEPEGKTFDPQYVPNGLARMQIWSALT